MDIIEAGDNVQRGISVLLGGLIGGLSAGLCCCLFSVLGGAVSAAALRFQHGGPITPKEGAIIGAGGGILTGVFGGIVAFGMSYFGFSFNNLFLNLVTQNPLYIGAGSLVITIPIGIVLGAVGGLLVAQMYK